MTLRAGLAASYDYSRRCNPPILHRKELLLPADHALVPAAVQLTQRLDRLDAFKDARRIGTRDGWHARLHALGLKLRDGDLVVAR